MRLVCTSARPNYGEATVLGAPYIGGYEPIKDASGAIIGIYFVGLRSDALG